MKKRKLKKKENLKIWKKGLKEKAINLAENRQQRKGLILT